MKNYIKKFGSIGLSDLPAVGGKNSSLGEMYSKLSSKGIPVPDGFATTAFAFEEFLEANDLRFKLNELMSSLDKNDFHNLREIGAAARSFMLQGTITESLRSSVIYAYQELCGSTEVEVAVRSSATAEDLPDASFAGQHESYLNIRGDNEVVEAIKRCYASLFTDRAIKYREDKGFAHDKVAISVGVQKMVRSDKGSSGVIFTLEPESGFRDIIHISGVWGLGENIVQGTVTPDEFFVFKPTLYKGYESIIQHKLGAKEKTMIYDASKKQEVINIDTPTELRDLFVLSDEEVKELAKWALIIEKHYGRPMDIEWAKDGITNQMFIIQARPETVHSGKDPLQMVEYSLKKRTNPVTSGKAIGSKIRVGVDRILQSPSDA